MTISELLERKGARVDPYRTGDLSAARKHKAASIQIAQHYAVFEKIKPALMSGSLRSADLSQAEQSIISAMIKAELIRVNQKERISAPKGPALRYITGGWLEELACLAAEAAGADEVLFSQQIEWSFEGYWGENEIDVIARFGDLLAFYSCKAYSSHYQNKNDKLMRALHEADNLVDHFGTENSFVGLIISTDLYDEYHQQPKYEALFGKARALDVDLITLEDLSWPRLVNAMSHP
nr:hypothetical protein [uncultured Cohaesibacter sp.]